MSGHSKARDDKRKKRVRQKRNADKAQTHKRESGASSREK
jgi:hypothetical protein